MVYPYYGFYVQDDWRVSRRLTLNLGVPGYLMGVIAILVAVVMTFVTIRMGLVWADMEDTFGHPPRGLRGAEG